MTNPWRLLLAAAALSVIVGAGTAAAQTVVVRNAPQGETIDVALNGTVVGSGSPDAEGLAKVPLDLNAHLKKTEIDANVFVDACDKRHRVIVVERGGSILPQEPGCDRREVSGLFWVRQVNTLVIDVGGTNPTLMLIKGEYSSEPARSWPDPPRGLVVFGGAGLTKFRDLALGACGNVTPCNAEDFPLTYTGGATYWITPYLGAEGSYIRPHEPGASGGPETFTFNHSLDIHIFTLMGKIGIPAGPVRFFGMVGGNYHDATSVTSETINGETQAFRFKTKGWNWAWGGGGEFWLASSFALYGELGFARLEDEAFEGNNGALDDHMRYMLFGARVRIGF